MAIPAPNISNVNSTSAAGFRIAASSGGVTGTNALLLDNSSDAGKLQLYHPDGSRAILRVATPAGDNDAATKAYVDGLISSGGSYIMAITVTAGAAGATSSTAKLPQNCKVLDAKVILDTPWSGGTAPYTLTVGFGGATATPAAFMGSGDINVVGTANSVYDVTQWTSGPTDSGGAVLTATQGNGGSAPTSGSATVIVTFTNPLS